MNANSNFKHFIIFFLLNIISQSGYGQINNLLFNDESATIILNFETDPPDISYLSSTGLEGIAHAEDSDGNILFYVNADGVFRSDGTVMPGSIGLYANPSSAEMNICLVPGETDQYYILYQLNLGCDPLYYSIVDMSLSGGLGDVSTLNIEFDATDHSEGMEIIRIPGTDEYWYLSYRCGIGIDRYKIDPSGITGPVTILPVAPIAFFGGLMELDYHSGKIAWGFNGTNQGCIANFDPTTGIASDLIIINDIDPYGAEFSLEGNKVYFVKWNTLTGDNIFQYDITTTTLSSYSIAPGCSLGQIELGGDGNLYINNYACNSIIKIENADSDSPVFTEIITTSTGGYGISDHIQSDVISEFIFTCNKEIVHVDCYGNETGSIEVIIENGEAPFDIQWAHAPGNTDLVLTDLAAGTYIIDIIDANGNSIHEEISITQPEFLMVDLDLIQPLCYGNAGKASINISGGTPPYSIDWHDINPELIPVDTHIVTVTDALECTVEVEYTIINTTQLEIEITTKNALCFDGFGSVDIEVSGGTPPYEIDWKGVDPKNLFAGEYAYIVSDANGCTTEETYIINEPENIKIDVRFEQTDCNKLTSIAYTSVEGGTPPYNINWLGYDTNNLSPNVYQVEVTDANGCSRKEAFSYKPSEAKVFIPNTFTPNKDGLNEYFLPNIDCYSSFKLMIFDRWGKFLFQTTSRNEVWDGTYNGSSLSSGMYIYKLKVVDTEGKIKEHNGYIQILR